MTLDERFTKLNKSLCNEENQHLRTKKEPCGNSKVGMHAKLNDSMKSEATIYVPPPVRRSNEAKEANRSKENRSSKNIEDVSNTENDAEYLLEHLRWLARTHKPLSMLIDYNNNNKDEQEAPRNLKPPSLKTNNQDEEPIAQQERPMWRRVQNASGNKTKFEHTNINKNNTEEAPQSEKNNNHNLSDDENANTKLRQPLQNYNSYKPNDHENVRQPSQNYNSHNPNNHENLRQPSQKNNSHNSYELSDDEIPTVQDQTLISTQVQNHATLENKTKAESAHKNNTHEIINKEEAPKKLRQPHSSLKQQYESYELNEDEKPTIQVLSGFSRRVQNDYTYENQTEDKPAEKKTVTVVKHKAQDRLLKLRENVNESRNDQT